MPTLGSTDTDAIMSAGQTITDLCGPIIQVNFLFATSLLSSGIGHEIAGIGSKETVGETLENSLSLLLGLRKARRSPRHRCGKKRKAHRLHQSREKKLCERVVHPVTEKERMFARQLSFGGEQALTVEVWKSHGRFHGTLAQNRHNGTAWRFHRMFGLVRITTSSTEVATNADGRCWADGTREASGPRRR